MKETENDRPRTANARSADIARLRQMLGLGRVKHEQEMERTAEAPRVAGEFRLHERELANRGALDVERERGATTRGTQQDYYDYLGESGINPTRVSRGGVSVSTGAGQRPQSPTDAMEKRLMEARSGYRGPMARLQRTVGLGGGSEGYLNALTSVLTRMGTLNDLQGDLEALKSVSGNTLDERIQALGADPSGLHPYEREWLELQLGR